MQARDSFDAPPPRQPGRVRRIDMFLSVREVDVPGTPAVEEVLDPETGEVLVAAVPEVPPSVRVDYIGNYQFHRPDEGGGSPEYCAGELQPHLTPTRKGHVKGLLDWALDKANTPVEG